MKLLNTKIKDGPKLIKTNIYKDKRGFFKETYKCSLIKKKKFPFDVMSFSKKNVLRGLHIQTKKSQEKFVTVVKGKILDVVVDLRKNSKTFGKNYKIILSQKNSKSIYIPAGFLHGFLGDNIGTEWDLMVDSPAEAIRAINCNTDYQLLKNLKVLFQYPVFEIPRLHSNLIDASHPLLASVPHTQRAYHSGSKRDIDIQKSSSR